MRRSPWITAGIASAAAVAVLGAAGLLVAAGASSGGTAASAATASPATTGITVSGTGDVSGTPDQVLLVMSVEVRRKTTTDALDAMSGSAEHVLASLRRSGVAAADLGTTGLSVQPDYRYDNSGQHLQGYLASESLSATLRSVRAAGQAVSSAVTAGGDAAHVVSMSLAIDKDSALMRQARARAFAAAKEKAVQYADLAGRGLGSLVSLTETETNRAQPLAAQAVPDAAAAAKAVPVAPGSQSVSVQVTATWAVR